MSKTAVVILNWNGRALLEKFLPVVIENSQHKGVEIIVADNFSADDSVSYLKENFPAIRIVQLDDNYGFAGGYNKALEQIEADYFVLLNSDVAPEPGWLSPLINRMDEDASLGACMPKVRDYKSPDKFEYAGASGGYIDVFGYPFCRGRILDNIEQDTGQYNEPIPVFWATGAALMIRANLYHQSGGLDESFFAHMEEIDLCWRIKNMGHKILVFPSSEVLHVGGATLSQLNVRKTFLNFRNNLLMLVKNLPSNKLFLILFIRMVLDGVAGIHFVLKGEFKHFAAVLKAHFSFYSQLSQVFQKRKQQLSLCVKREHNEMYPQSVIWAFYVKGLRKFSELKHFNLH
ncbi:glycosyltransferase family 2 protein [Carboxylicivirga marina]|uniref:Glycosyltransferase family 2 protein n=1 Tax=Carboxylicivirga marina TaxID=2800988 RepID=A0ABS1HLD2_9BACT|nr:glycosyltransferase family 2 protein [Carboxylicivirga marina]MBK3518420.1 glycosyltransferase family 2 protein [Carboxylicivirga marina]